MSAELDDLEAKRRPSAKIHSIRHGTEELLHVRLLLQQVRYDISVSYDDDGPLMRNVDYSVKPLTPLAQVDQVGYVMSSAGDCHHNSFGQYARPTGESAYQSFSNYNNIVVPMEVIERMKAAEGIHGPEYWERRGVEVGKESWGVLTAWVKSR